MLVRGVSKAISQKVNKDDLIHFVCVLNGAKRFTNDVVDKLSGHNFHISYIKTVSTHNMKLKKNIDFEYVNIPKANFFANKKIFILDDLIDSGNTTLAIKNHLLSLGYEQVFIVALFNKYKENNTADIVGLDLKYSNKKFQKDNIKDYWLYGYGMDLEGKYRDLDEVRAFVVT